MTTHANNSGTWRETLPNSRAGGVWRVDDTTYGNAGGTWRETFKNEIVLIDVSPQVAWEGYENSLDWTQTSTGIRITNYDRTYATVNQYDLSRFTRLVVNWSCPDLNDVWIRLGLKDWAGANTWSPSSFTKTTSWSGAINDSAIFSADFTGSRRVVLETIWQSSLPRIDLTIHSMKLIP